jgi:hypothetical protein
MGIGKDVDCKAHAAIFSRWICRCTVASGTGTVWVVGPLRCTTRTGLGCTRPHRVDKSIFNDICEALNPDTHGGIQALILLEKMLHLVRSSVRELQELLEWNWQLLPHDTAHFSSPGCQVLHIEEQSQHCTNIFCHVATNCMNSLPSASIRRVPVITQSVLQHTPQRFDGIRLCGISQESTPMHFNGVLTDLEHLLTPTL